MTHYQKYYVYISIYLLHFYYIFLFHEETFSFLKKCLVLLHLKSSDVSANQRGTKVFLVSSYLLCLFPGHCVCVYIQCVPHIKPLFLVFIAVYISGATI